MRLPNEAIAERAFVYAVVIFVGASVVGGVLSLVPVLGSIVAAFPFFYATVMATYVFCNTYAAMHPVEIVDDSPSVALSD